MKRFLYALAALAVIALAFLLVIYLFNVYEIRLNALNQENADEMILCEQGPSTLISTADCYLRVIVPATRNAATAFFVLNPLWLLMLMYSAAGTLSAGVYYLMVLYSPAIFGLTPGAADTELTVERFLLRVAVSATAGFMSFWLVAAGLSSYSAFAEADSSSGYQWALIVPMAAGLFLATFMERIKNVLSKNNQPPAVH